MSTLPHISSMLSFGAEVIVVPKVDNPRWPVSGFVRYAGLVVACDSISIAVLGHSETWDICPEPIPEDWPTTEEKTQKWPWSPIVMINKPNEWGWVKSPIRSLVVFPMSGVAICLAKIPGGVEVVEKKLALTP